MKPDIGPKFRDSSPISTGVLWRLARSGAGIEETRPGLTWETHTEPPARRAGGIMVRGQAH